MRSTELGAVWVSGVQVPTAMARHGINNPPPASNTPSQRRPGRVVAYSALIVWRVRVPNIGVIRAENTLKLKDYRANTGAASWDRSPVEKLLASPFTSAHSSGA